MASIQSLSTELHLIIAENLNLADRTCLKYTNRYFLHTILGARAHDWIELLRDLNANLRGQGSAPKFIRCYECRQIRHGKKYADDLVEKLKLKINSSTVPDHKINWTGSFCLDCGMVSKRQGYRPGDVLVVMDMFHIVCTGCYYIKVMHTTKRPALCQECLVDAGKAGTNDNATSQTMVNNHS